jgi:hypothetical protein
LFVVCSRSEAYNAPSSDAIENEIYVTAIKGQFVASAMGGTHFAITRSVHLQRTDDLIVVKRRNSIPMSKIQGVQSR